MVIVTAALGTAQVWSPRKNVVLLAVPEARRAVATVPELILEALIAVKAEPLPDIEVKVPALAVKLPDESRKTIVLAPLAEAAVVKPLPIVPLVIFEALIAVNADPLAVMMLAVKLPLASLATMVEAPLELFAVV